MSYVPFYPLGELAMTEADNLEHLDMYHRVAGATIDRFKKVYQNKD